MPDEDEEIFGRREVTKFKAFGRPYDIGAGPLDWFEREGMPLGEWNKPCRWYSGEVDHPTVVAQSKMLFAPKHEQGCRVFE